MSVNIHGKEYITVAERLAEAKGDKEMTLTRVLTEVLQHQPVVVIKATVELEDSNTKKIFTGISSANPAKAIEKTNPYEVAETSAVGRALGFAGYGIVEGIASADEMNKSLNEQSTASEESFTREPVVNPDNCEHNDFWVNTVKKEGPNKGKEFKSCKKCKSFLGFMPTQPVKEEKEEEPEWIKG